MQSYIKARVGYNGYNDNGFITCQTFKVVGRLPAVGDVLYGDSANTLSHYFGERERVIAVRSVVIDSLQDSDEVFDFDYFEVVIRMEYYNEELDLYEHDDVFYGSFFAIKKNEGGL